VAVARPASAEQLLQWVHQQQQAWSCEKTELLLQHSHVEACWEEERRELQGLLQELRAEVASLKEQLQ
jgi:hypothetical protein